MNWKTRVRQRLVGASLGTAFTLLAGLLFYYTVAGNGLVTWSYDLPFALRRPTVPTNAVIIYLDDASHQVMKQPFNAPWDRTKHAELVQRLTNAGAAAVVFDILFTDDGPVPGADVKFRDAIKAQGKVVLSGLYVKDGPLTTVEKPLPLLRDAAAGWGLAQFEEPELGVRRHLPVFEDLPSLAWVAAKVVDAPVTKVSTQGAERRWMNYYGPPGALPSVSYHQAYFPDGVPADFFRSKVVFIGARPSAGFTGAGKDEFPTSYTWITQAFAPGVEIHATIFLNLQREEWLTRMPPALEVTLIILMSVLAGFGLSIMRSTQATVAALGMALVTAALAWLLFRYQLVWFAWLIPLVQIAVGLFWSTVNNSIQAYIERTVLERSLALHLPARRVKQILKQPELLTPSAEKQEVSLMFTDIADWSTISDRVTPDRLFKLLNRYFQETVPCIHETDGMVLQFIGDAIFAVWNAPEPQPDHTLRACRAALSLREKLIQFESSNEGYPLHTRVGLHCGLASVGNCGSADRFVYTALGADTNMASRLEGLNKYLGTGILASDKIVETAEEEFVWRNVGRFRLKGADRVFEVSELVGALSSAEATQVWRRPFSAALKHFRQAAWDDAESGFREVLKVKPDDGPARFYLKQIEKFRGHPLPDKWFGEVSMDEVTGSLITLKRRARPSIRDRLSLQMRRT